MKPQTLLAENRGENEDFHSREVLWNKEFCIKGKNSKKCLSPNNSKDTPPYCFAPLKKPSCS